MENNLIKINETENKLTQINESEAQNYTLLGKACGRDFNHCFYLGSKYKPDFSTRVRAYRIIDNDLTASLVAQATGKEYIAIEFYEPKG